MFNINPATIHKTIFDKIPVRGRFEFVIGPPGIWTKVSPTQYAKSQNPLRTSKQIIGGMPNTNTGRVKYYIGLPINTQRTQQVWDLNPAQVVTEANHGADGA